MTGLTTFGTITPPEWIALFTFLASSTFVIHGFYLSAFSHHWKLWFESRRFVRPWFLIGPIIYTVFFAFFVLMSAIAIFMVWR